MKKPPFITPTCGHPSHREPLRIGEINYTAQQINELLSLIPDKADKKEVFPNDSYLGHFPMGAQLPDMDRFAWAFVGDLDKAHPYFYYPKSNVPQGYQPGWNDMAKEFGTYLLTPGKQDQLTAEELFKEKFRLPELTADRAIADEQGNRITDTYVKREAVANQIKQIYNQQFLDNPPLITEGYITPEMLSEETKQMLENTGQEITNLPDGEDLQSVHGVLKFADKEYNPNSYDGLGKRFVRRNIVNGVNTLVQSQVKWANTLYIFRYDHDLQGKTITIPEGCTLKFESGKIYNGTIILNGTLVRPYGGNLKDYIDCKIEGTFRKGQVLYSEEYKQTVVWTGEKWKCSYSVLFRVFENKLQQSVDDGATWENVSDHIASYFRFVASQSDPNSIGKIQISQDNKEWSDLSPEFTNYLKISDYVATTSALPVNPVLGTIYGVGTDPQTGYELYVYTSKGWVNNGKFTSIAAGIVQETGNSENVVMSQKAVSEKLSELDSEVDAFNEWGVANNYSEVLIDDDSKILESRDLKGNKTIHTDLEVKGSFKSKELQQLEVDLNEKLEWAESSKLSEVLIDEDGKILESRSVDGTKNINTDVNFKNIEQLTSVDSMSYITVLLDKEGKEILAIDKIGNVILNRLVSRCNIIENNNYKGRILSYLGDSLSSPNNWAKGCENVLNMIIKGSGIGGTSIAGTATTCYHQNSRINALNIDAKVIFIQGGTNDCRFYVKQGEKSKNNYDTTTFWGGFNVMLSKIYYKYLKQSKGFYNNIDYSGVIQVEKPYVKIPIYVILPPTIPVDESDVNNYSDYRDGIALRRQDLIELCELWGLDYIDANQIGYNYMTNESSDVVHGSSNNFFDILGAKVVSKLMEYNSAMTFFDKYAEEMFNINLVDNSAANAKVNQKARVNSNVSITFKSLPNSVSVLSNGAEIPITWVDRINNIACKFVMPNNNVNITIN